MLSLFSQGLISRRSRVAEDELTRQQALLRAIIDNSTAIIFVKDDAGHYLLTNQRYPELFHLDADAMRGLRDEDLFPAEVAANLRRADQEVIRSGQAREYEETVPLSDGTHTYLVLKFPCSMPMARFTRYAALLPTSARANRRKRSRVSAKNCCGNERDCPSGRLVVRSGQRQRRLDLGSGAYSRPAG